MTGIATFAAVLFDIDGTLVDSNELHVRAWVEAFHRHGHEIPPDAVRKQIGKGGDQLVPSLIPSVPAPVAKKMSSAHDSIFRERYLATVQPFPGAANLVKRVHEAGLKVALASSAKHDEVNHYIDLLGVRPVVDVVTSADDVEKSKPAGDIFASALAKLGSVPPARAVVIGDTPYDVQAANACGIATVGLLSGGFSERELLEAGAIEIFADVSVLLEALGHPGR